MTAGVSATTAERLWMRKSGIELEYSPARHVAVSAMLWIMSTRRKTTKTFKASAPTQSILQDV